jgi:mRNA interferase MazF
MPHTTALRGTRFEAVIDLPRLEKGGFDAQGIRNVPGSVFLQKLGSLNSEQMKIAEAAIRRIFGLE